MRTTVHKLFKVYESGKYCTTTVGDSIQVSLSSNMSHNDRARSQRANRRDNPPFCLFHLYKENQDTMAVIQRIARILKYY
jgi:tRNA(Glu) U13 pseudouridine synthase TruD